MRVHHADLGTERAGDADHRLAVALGDAGDADRRLAVHGLEVDTALAGDHQVGVAHVRVEVHRRGDDLDAGLERGAEEGQHRRAHAAGRTRARHRVDRHAEVAPDDAGEAGEVGVERLHHLGRGALLRAKYRRGPTRAGERVVHIAGDFDAAFGQARIERGDVDTFQAGEITTAAVELAALEIEQTRTERLHHAGAAVVGGAATNAEDEAARTGVERGADQLAGAAGAGEERVAPVRRNQRQAAGGRHLDHRGVAIAGEAVEGLHGFTERAADRHGLLASAGRGDHRVHRALAAVRHRHQHVVGVGENLAEAGFDRLRDFERGQAFLVRIGGDDDLHGGCLRCMCHCFLVEAGVPAKLRC